MYRIKLTKWFQGTFDSIQHPLFWLLLYLCRCMRSPLRHFFAYVQDNVKTGETLKALVTGKLHELNDEFASMDRNLPQIISRAAELSGCDRLFSDDPNSLQAVALIARKIFFQQWSSFQRRIFYPLQQLPVCVGRAFAVGIVMCCRVSVRTLNMSRSLLCMC